ncbi:transposase [Aquimarina sp. RZ0]|uniref:IS66 family transposase n=1 Tax=Aquimarina sp. RZ0 TaxID=2607730 RepID=UPI0011F2810F|nr:transposase [Aquimarina sp. RZ0]KAA1242673.1 transposase [Aquimarina sp. RZ0]
MSTERIINLLIRKFVHQLPFYRQQQIFKSQHLDISKGKLHMGYHWVHHAPIERLVLFKYDRSRSRKVPEEILQDYNGTIQTDGYSGYPDLSTKGSITLLACMAHPRRYFEKALDNDAS